MCGIEEIRVKVCITKLEVARYDIICMDTLIRELQTLTTTSGQGPVIDECFEQMALLYTYKSQIKHIGLMLEETILKSKIGGVMLDYLNERMPPP